MHLGGFGFISSDHGGSSILPERLSQILFDEKASRRSTCDLIGSTRSATCGDLRGTLEKLKGHAHKCIIEHIPFSLYMEKIVSL